MWYYGKVLMIECVQSNRDRYLKEGYGLMETFSFESTLFKLLLENGMIPKEYRNVY